MMTDYCFWIDIDLGNVAMRTPKDVARALYKLADKLEDMSADEAMSDDWVFADDNGNSVGSWGIICPNEEEEK